MVCYHLKIQEHDEYGENGIVILKNNRDYFQPATSGLQVAHDILEHTVKPHNDGYIDELMALGGVLAGRVENGWTSQYNRILRTSDLSSDISSLASSALMQNQDYGDSLCPKSCSSFIKDSELMDNIKSFVIKGLIEAINEHEDKEYTSIPKEYHFDIKSIVGWICKGYQLYKKRFSDTYSVSKYLFDKIAVVCDKWLKTAEEGMTAKLYVNFTTFDVRLDDDYWE